MYAITIKQPWVWAIFNAGKDIENRTWELQEKHLNTRVYIHSSAQNFKMFGRSNAFTDFELALVNVNKISGSNLTPEKFIALPDLTYNFGAIIGSVEIIGCGWKSANHPSYSRWHQVGCCGFKLKDPILLPEPIFTKGQLGFWDCSEVVK